MPFCFIIPGAMAVFDSLCLQDYSTYSDTAQERLCCLQAIQFIPSYRTMPLHKKDKNNKEDKKHKKSKKDKEDKNKK